MDNPLLMAWSGPFGLPPFDAIEPAHFRPAFDAAFAEHKARDRRASPPTRAADLRQYDRRAGAGGPPPRRRRRGLLQSCRRRHDARLQAIERDIAAAFSRHSSDISLNAALFRRIDALYATREALGLTPEQAPRARATINDFVRAGARLNDAEQGAARRDQRAAGDARRSFRQNVLADEKSGCWCSTRAISTALPDFRAGAARTRPSADRPANMSSRCRAPASSRSCNSRRGATCARRRFAPGRAAARTAGATDNRADHRRNSAAARRARAAAGLRQFRRISSSTTRWRRRRPRCATCSIAVWAPAAPRAARGARGARRRWSQTEGGNFDRRGLGLALLCREACAQARIRSRRGRAEALSPARQHDRGGLRRRATGCSASPSPSAATCRSTIPTCAHGR